MRYKGGLKNCCVSVLGCSLILAAGLAQVRAEEKLVFSLPDTYGRHVDSQDYAGVPVFLEFGACW